MVDNTDIQVLVIEDDADIRELIVLHLLRQKYTVSATGSGEEGLSLLQKKPYDLVIIDWMLPGISGIEILHNIQENFEANKPGILMVTARAEPEDIVKGLEEGADDYLTKPFEPSVLLARCKAILRRSEQSSNQKAPKDSIKLGDLEIWPEQYEVKCGPEAIQLTRFEFRLLLALCENQGKVLTRKRLIELVQGENIVVIDRTIDTHVFSLRKKLGACSSLIETIRGVGYRLSVA